MAYHYTGRSRTVTLALNAVEQMEPGIGPVWSTSGAFGCLFSARTFVHDVQYFGDATEYYAQVMTRLEVEVTLRGVLSTTTYTTYHLGQGDPVFGVDPAGFSNTVDDWVAPTPPATAGLTGVLNVALVLREYLSDGLGTDPFSTLVEIPYSLQADFTVTGNYTYLVNDGSPVPVSFSDTESYALTLTPSAAALTVDEYSGGLYFQGYSSITNGVGISAPGLAFGSSASATDPGSTLSGSLASATFAKTDTTTLGEGSLTIGPDWAVEVQVQDYDWEHLDPLVGVETELYFGDGTLLSTETTGVHRYPSGSAFKGRTTVSVRNNISGGPPAVSGENYQRLWNVNSGALTTYGFWVRPSFAWADAAGRYLPSNGNTPFYPNRIFLSHVAGTLQLASSYRWTIWDTVGNVFGTNCTVAADGAYLKITNANAFFSSVGQLTLSSTTQEGSAPFRPVPYRYYRARIKSSVAGRRVRFVWGSHTFDFTTTTADWEVHEFDLPMPDAYLNSTRWPAAPTQLRFEHPADMQATTPNDFKANGNWNVRFPDAVGTDEYWLDYVEGFVKEEGRAHPVLLIGPCEVSDRSPYTFSALENTSEVCAHPPAPIPGTTDGFGGELSFRLIVNGVVGLNLRTTSTTLTAWFTLMQRYCGTGLTLTDSGHAMNAVCHSGNAWVDRPQDTESAALELDTPVDLRAHPQRYLCGYYGMGNTRTGDYDSVLQFEGERQWDGEILGNAWNTTDGSVSGAPLALVDDDGTTVLDSTVSNVDGFFRLFAKYGVNRPFTNAGASCAARQQYTGTTPDNYVYTATGEDFNSYWLRGNTLLDKDGSDFASFVYTRDRYPVFDRLPYLRNIEATGINFAAQDLIQFLGVPWWLRVRAQGAVAVIERSLDAGVTWDETETISSPVALETDTYPSVPTLSRTRWDEVLCAFHDEDGDALLYLSTDMGETFNLHATHPLLRYPRVVVQDERTWLCAHDGTQLCFYRTEDYAVTITGKEVIAMRITCPVQLAAFGQDRRGILHVLYRDSGDTLYHRYSADGAAWSSAASVALAAAYPSWAHTSPVALVTWFTGDTLHVGVFEADYRTFDAELSAPSGSWTPGHLGLAASHREEFMLLGDQSGTAEVRYSPDEGSTWDTPS